jgi:DNA-binding CsgD family transcriptional regulator
MAHLGEADVTRLLEVVGAIDYDEANDALNPEPLALLAHMLDASTVGYLAFDGPVRCCNVPASVDVCAERQPYIGRCEEIERRLYANPWPFKRATSPGVRLLEDVTTRPAFHRTALFNEVIRVVHDEPMAEICLSRPGDGRHRKILLCRPDDSPRAFGEYERRILELLAPHFARPIFAADARRRRQARYRLTRRELEVLRLVGLGKSNAEVAAELWVSPLTVRSHLENIFAKLAVHSRAEAVAVAGPIGRVASREAPYQNIVSA